MSGAWAMMPAAGMGLALALWACFDPLMSAMLGLREFPYLPSAVLAVLLAASLVMVTRGDRLWQAKEQLGLAFVIGMAQVSGMSFGKMDLLELATMVAFGWWLLIALVEERRPIQMSPVMWFVLGLFFFAILAFLNRPPLTSYIAIGEKFILFMIVVDLIRSHRLMRFAARFAIGAGIFSALVAVVQCAAFLLMGEVLTFGVPEENPEAMLKPTFLGMMVRAMGFFPNPAGLNDFLLFALPLALFAALASPTAGGRWGLLAATGLMAAAVVVTWSASGLLCLGLLALVSVYVHRPAWTIQFTAFFVLVGIAAWWAGLLDLGLALLDGFGASSSGSVRVDLLRLGIISLHEHPLIGVGIQNFGSVSGNFFPVGSYVFKYPVHNAFVQMATELGLIGGLLFLGIVIWMTVRVCVALARSPVEPWLFRGIFLGWIALVVHMMTEPMAYEGTLWMLFGIIEGSVMTVLRPDHSVDQSSLA